MYPSGHTFHIPVMGLGYTIDTPAKVARYGISSVISIIEDNLVEEIRKRYCEQMGENYFPISKKEPDYRARRITEYLNLMGRIVDRQVTALRSDTFENGSDLVKYFEMLPDGVPVRIRYEQMLREKDPANRIQLQEELRALIRPGSIDVNIMTKCDRINYDRNGEPLPAEFADAMAALRGFANSALESAVIFSAGMNPRLYSYCESFPDFLPDASGLIRKKIILKVSDFRSALIQGKFLAKRGLWVSEFRVESGLNCGGHAFPTDGYLLGPILEEFRSRRHELITELETLYLSALKGRQLPLPLEIPSIRITAQGGIGTFAEQQFLLEHYDLYATGWGSPFLLVPEVTNVDPYTLGQLSTASPEDYYLSNASPLGIAFHNFRKSSGNAERNERIRKGRPGSPCKKKFLAFNTEFEGIPLCTSSRAYQEKKLGKIRKELPDGEQRVRAEQIVLEKECLCEGLAASAMIADQSSKPSKDPAVSVCPGPNLAYFSGTFTLREMTDHIYGRGNIRNGLYRPSVFINELKLYMNHFRKEVREVQAIWSDRKQSGLLTFRENLANGIDYYRELLIKVKFDSEAAIENMKMELSQIREELFAISLPVVQ
ncbi:MAG: hypothetical protein KBA16_05235 [Bacteroidia bacterium]|nr:hypothetical protein [Bacteroidia bacterium]